MSHGNAIINSYCIKFCCITSHSLYFLLHNLTDFVKMSMPWNKLSKTIDNRNNWFTKLFMLHSSRNPQSSGTCHFSAFCTNCTSQLMFHIGQFINLLLYNPYKYKDDESHIAHHTPRIHIKRKGTDNYCNSQQIRAYFQKFA